MKKNTTPVIEAIGEMNFEGNIIPHSWYQHIRLPLGERERKHNKKCDKSEIKTVGKSDVVAIILLSDVVYWYRPTIRRDELTGAIVSIEKKFYEDMLQKQYETWGELFGFTKRQTRDAVSRLVSAGLLKREFRNITSKSGTKLNNVMFIEPVIESIKRITFTHPETRAMIEELPPYDVQTPEVSRLNVAPTTFDVDTNTEITTETTTETTTNIPNQCFSENDDIPESSQDSLSGTPDDENVIDKDKLPSVQLYLKLQYVQTIVDFFNGLKGRYPDKIRAKINRPAKIATVEKFAKGRYRTILKWYERGIPTDYICDLLLQWISELKTAIGGSLNYFEDKEFSYISADKQSELDAYKKELFGEEEDE